ncbi:MAG: tetraacyldisaccharide 4'-kinase, partial [Armatimonadetes bacterium]|nr:tetraacyldisaccharide 4'-kinase [Armatimonadota bacterium]
PSSEPGGLRYRRVLLKLSGEALLGEKAFGIDHGVLGQYAADVREAVDAGAQVALLDDGYQYFRMARDLNIALISARVGSRTARLFPRGIWREPWSHLDRADQVWITHANEVPAEQVADVRAKVAQYAPGTPVVEAGYEPRELISLDGQHAAPNALAGQAVLAVSGLGCPESFEYALRKLGATVVALRFGDHHRYRLEDWAVIAGEAEASGATCVVTTEKDAVKLPPDPPVPVRVLRSELRLGDGCRVVAESLDRVAQSVT